MVNIIKCSTLQNTEVRHYVVINNGMWIPINEEQYTSLKETYGGNSEEMAVGGLMSSARKHVITEIKVTKSSIKQQYK